MTRRELITLCLSYPGVVEDYPFHDDVADPNAWAVLRHGPGQKAFAFIFERGGLCVNLKCEPMQADFLRKVYPGVQPAYHMNKQHWNSVYPDTLPVEELRAMLNDSYRLTLPAAPKRRPAAPKTAAKKAVPAKEKQWQVYLLRCADDTLYTGIALDVAKRAAAHNAGRGAKYTRSRRPVTVLYTEGCAGKSAALQREAAIKKLPRAQKLALANGAAQ